MLRHSIAIALTALLVAAVPAAAQEPTPDPATAAAEQARQQAEAPGAGPRFDPTSAGFGACMNEPAERVQPTVPPGVDLTAIPNAAGWIVSGPRTGLRPGAPVTVTLRDKAGTKNRMAYADITAPDGTTARAGSTLFGDGTAKLAYPTDFRAATATAPGAYTVVWRDTITDRFIACDGFVVSS